MKILQSKSNIANKVRNTYLPRTKPLLPLFEVVSNSIHAIKEAKKENLLNSDGNIQVEIVRNGDPATLASMKLIDNYPINSFRVKDDGIGLNDANLNYFIESDTDHKMEIGGRGIGRFVCLKAFQYLEINSTFKVEEDFINRNFTFKNTKDGFHDFVENISTTKNIGTEVALMRYKDEYLKNVPTEITDISKELVEHFLLYFINKSIPNIFIVNQNNDFVNCRSYFELNFKRTITDNDFEIGENKFTLYVTKSNSSLSHKIHFCAHNRSVREEGLVNRIVDLGSTPIIDEEGNYYYQVYVTGKFLDENVNPERVGFNFPNDEREDDEDEQKEISLAKIRKLAINTLENMLKDYLDEIRNKKLENYGPIITGELPQYNYIIAKKSEEVRRIKPNLTKSKLDIELYKIESNWKLKVKEEGENLMKQNANDISNWEDYKNRYDKFITEFNEVGKSDLARYVVHRRAVIELLEKLLTKADNNRFHDEELLHSIFFPIRSSSDEIPHDKQNLWLLDERLTYHTFLASDKKFETIKSADINSADRVDLLIYNDALIFAEDKYSPYQSFTIVEFKKPQRENYQDYDAKKNPLDQVEKYIKEILAGKVQARNGRKINVDKKIPFYVYIICDLNSSLISILESREFDKTPDGQGYFKMYTKYFNAYIEVLPFEKVLIDAKKRNRVLFEKLGISQS